nr:MAG TPA: hypothetical protein [Caudoviricetes sp.]
MMDLPRKGSERGAAQNGRRFSHTLREEVRPCPLRLRYISLDIP